MHLKDATTLSLLIVLTITPGKHSLYAKELETAHQPSIAKTKNNLVDASKHPEPQLGSDKKEAEKNTFANASPAEYLTKDKQRAMQQGDQCYKQRKYEQAVAWFSYASKLDPNDSSSHLRKADCFEKMLDDSKALTEYTRAIELNASLPAKDKEAEYWHRATLYQSLGKYKEMVADLTKTIELNPTNGSYYNARAAAYEHLNEQKKAIQDYSQAIVLIPKEKPLLFAKRGRAYLRLRDFDSAVNDCTRSIVSGNHDAGTYEVRADAYTAKKNFTAALADLDTAILCEKLGTVALSKKAQLLQAMGDYKSAAVLREKSKEMQDELAPGKFFGK